MDNLLQLCVGAMEILLLNLVLSGDNIGVIALATRNLPEEYEKKASIIGISAAILMRIFFCLIVVWIISIQWLPIKLVGGLLLVWITWDFIKPQSEKEEKDNNINQSGKFWSAVSTIILADITMSLDNVLAIASASEGDIWLIIFGLVMSIPILFFGSQFVMSLMKKYSIVVYVGGAILTHTAFNMMFEDGYVSRYMTHTFAVVIPWVLSAGVLAYGIYYVRKVGNTVVDNDALYEE